MNYNPANAVHFREIDPRFNHSQQIASEHFIPVLECADTVSFQIQRSGSVAGVFVQVIDVETGGSLAIAAPIADDILSPGYYNFNIPMGDFCDYVIKFRLFEPGFMYDSEIYVVKDNCTHPTVLITYWNDSVIRGGNTYPDIVYANGFRGKLRVFGSLESDGGDFTQTLSTTSAGTTSVCRADFLKIFRLTAGPAPDWIHAKLEYVFLHQNITIQKQGETSSIALVANGGYNQEQQAVEHVNLYIGSGRMREKEHGLITSV